METIAGSLDLFWSSYVIIYVHLSSGAIYIILLTWFTVLCDTMIISSTLSIYNYDVFSCQLYIHTVHQSILSNQIISIVQATKREGLDSSQSPIDFCTTVAHWMTCVHSFLGSPPPKKTKQRWLIYNYEIWIYLAFRVVDMVIAAFIVGCLKVSLRIKWPLIYYYTGSHRLMTYVHNLRLFDRRSSL